VAAAEDHPRYDHQEGDEGNLRGTHQGEGGGKTCHKELAELYEERLRAEELTVSIEPTR
jgi:hypothetical protein